jgi:two-component system CheB/CheR fusion protein
MSETITDPDFERLLDYLRSNRGVDFTGYKRNTLTRRIRRRMEMVHCDTYAEYLAFLNTTPREFIELFNFILINVTNFFRDAEAWSYIAETVIPRILEGKRRDEQIRVWSAGCASGQEAYTIAMLLTEALGEDLFRERVKIYATDIDDEALNEARQGIYNSSEVENLPPEFLEKYFRPLNQRFAFRKELRRALIFGRHDLGQDAPISRLDLLICRNLLMYFNSETQKRVLSRLHFALNGTGYLMLGRAEMLLTHTNLFTPADLRRRVFSKVPNARMREGMLMLTEKVQETIMTPPAIDLRLRMLVFDSNPVAQIVLDVKGHLFMMNERAQALFGLVSRDIGRPVQDFELFYRPVALRPPLTQTHLEHRLIGFKDVFFAGATGENHWYDVQVIPMMDSNDTILGTLLTYTDVTLMKRLHDQLEQTNQELETAYEELQSTNEEMETTNEELQSTVEELETTNE